MNIQHPDSTEPSPSLMRPLQWLSNSVPPSIKTAFFKNILPKAHTCGSQKTCGNCFGSRDWTQVVWLCIKLHTEPSHTFNTVFHKSLHTLSCLTPLTLPFTSVFTLSCLTPLTPSFTSVFTHWVISHLWHRFTQVLLHTDPSHTFDTSLHKCFHTLSLKTPLTLLLN